MQLQKALIPFILVLAAGCATATPATPAAAPTSAPTGTSAPTDPPTIASSAAPQTILIIDDFESDESAWQICVDPECTDSSAIGVKLTSENATQGNQALELNFEKNDKPKAVFYLERPMALSGGRAVQFDVYNPGTVDGVGFALTTGPDSIWHESDSAPVKRKTRVTLRFDLTAGNYKTAATDWEFRASLADLSDVARLSIVAYPNQTGSIFIDNLRLTD